MKKLLRIVACMVSLGVLPAQATTYSLSFPTLSVSGSVTTDGNTGTLGAADITAWHFDQTADIVHYPANMDNTGPTSSLTLTGSALTATATGLFFNFSTTSPAFLNFTSDGWPGTLINDHGLSLEFCGATTSCLNQNNASSTSSVELVLIAGGCCSTSGGLVQEGSVQIGIAEVVVTPLPAALPLFATGLSAIGLLGWRRKRKVQAGA